MLRIFTGIEIDKSIREYLHETTKQIPFKKASITKPKNIHLTLNFLGYIEDKTIEEIKNSIEDIAIKHNECNIEIEKLGAFPNLKKARIFWAGLKGDTDKIISLQKDIENSLSIFGIKKEKRNYYPHITLARLRMIQDISKDLKMELTDMKINVRDVSLFVSELKPKGAEYSVIKKFKLNA